MQRENFIKNSLYTIGGLSLGLAGEMFVGERETEKKIQQQKEKDKVLQESEYIRDPNTGILIAKEIPDEFRSENLNYEDLHLKVLSQESFLHVPTPGLYLPFIISLIDAYKRKIPLFDENDNKLTNSEIEKVYYDLIKYPPYRTFLNARFVQGTGFKGLDIEKIVGLKKIIIGSHYNGLSFIPAQGEKKVVRVEREPLEECLWDDCYIDLRKDNFNRQGLPLEKARSKVGKRVGEGYEGDEWEKNPYIFYAHPEKDHVISVFDSGSLGYCLGCSDTDKSAVDDRSAGPYFKKGVHPYTVDVKSRLSVQ